MFEELAKQALKAREKAYCPYSGFAVGAAVMTADRQHIYTGCNIENSSFSASCCAERTAVFKAVSQGEHGFAAIAIAGGPAGAEPSDYTPPCGSCRQVLSEFCDPEMPVILVKSSNEMKTYSLGQLLPVTFALKEN
jgi:homotetrameric cytidine deaminase